MLKDKRKRERKRERADNNWEGQVRGNGTRKRWEMQERGQRRGGRCIRMHLKQLVQKLVRNSLDWLAAG